jgi:enhancing lycopene biosynthesis protein 2
MIDNGCKIKKKLSMNKSPKIAVILAGSGVFDGSEIHEATMTLYAIMKNGATYQAFAPEINQYHVINHITGEVMKETRNVLIESARISRGNIKPLKQFNASEYDAMIIPGGYGAAKNLCSFAFDGADCSVNDEVITALKQMIAAKKPVGALCIAPVILARVLGNHVKLTIGTNDVTASAIEKMGAQHKKTGLREITVDTDFKIVTSPCYMLKATILDIAESADKVVKEILKLSK